MLPGFQRAERVPPFVDDAITIGAKVVWMQLDIVHEEAARKARSAGLEVIMDRCIKIDHAHLFENVANTEINTRH
jgi:predicted CoA-binding protein